MTDPYIPPEAARDIDWVFERYFDDIASKVDDIAQKYNLTNAQVLRYVGNWEFQDYYEEWIQEGWDED